MNWQEQEDYNRKILDTIDIRPYLRSYANVADIKDSLEEDFSWKVADDAVMEGELFNFLDTEDFAFYLNKRYNISVHEEISYKLGWVDNGTNK